MTDIAFMAVNDHSRSSKAHYRHLRHLVNYPVYQDKPSTNIWNTLEGHKDDFFIYDRCGRLTYYLPLPHSDLTRPTTAQAITSTYLDRPCGYCAEDPADTEPDHHDEDHEDGDDARRAEAAGTNEQDPTSQLDVAEELLHNHTHHVSTNGSGHMNVTAGETVPAEDTATTLEMTVAREIENVVAVNAENEDEPSLFTRMRNFFRRFFSNQEANRVTSRKDYRGEVITKL